MKRLIIAVIVGLLGGSVIGFAAGIFVYPFWFLTDVANETLAENPERVEIAAGEFIHANPSDPVHWGKGRVSVYREGESRNAVHLHADFEVGPGPRFHVYLVDRGKVTNSGDFKAAQKVDLGRLRAFKGSQIYPTPPGVEPADYKSVVVWCKEFGVLISPASLMQTNAGPV
ncbi:MAG: DM13 domain-containing protein [Alphaproteobacteria bacterium]|nr:DM13 domain-containing protein [Alphaproteobacteria bacterium]